MTITTSWFHYKICKKYPTLVESGVIEFIPGGTHCTMGYRGPYARDASLFLQGVLINGFYYNVEVIVRQWYCARNENPKRVPKRYHQWDNYVTFQLLEFDNPNDPQNSSIKKYGVCSRITCQFRANDIMTCHFEEQCIFLMDGALYFHFGYNPGMRNVFKFSIKSAKINESCSIRVVERKKIPVKSFFKRLDRLLKREEKLRASQ